MEANKTEYMNINIHEMDVRREGKKEAKKEAAQQLIEMNVLTDEQISKATNLSIDQILELKQKASETTS